MATTVMLNGTNYQVPAVGESGWGAQVSNYLIALSTGVLSKAGGTFTLTNDANFGANYGLLSAYFSTRDATPASAGLVRLAVGDIVNWRNNADDGNLGLGVDASDQLTFNSQVVPRVIRVSDASNWTGSQTTVTYDVSSYTANASHGYWQLQDAANDNRALKGVDIRFPTSTSVKVTVQIPLASGTYYLVGIVK